MSDSGYRHENISCMTHDIHVDILLGCLSVCVTIACALRWGVALVGVISLLGFAHPRCGTPFKIHEKTTLCRGREYKEGRVVALRSIFVKYIRAI